MSSPEQNARVSADGGVVKRKRPAACVHCHQRKVRCDARTVGLPCTNCRTAGKHDCRIHEKKKRAAVRSLQHPVPIRCAPVPERTALQNHQELPTPPFKPPTTTPPFVDGQKHKPEPTETSRLTSRSEGTDVSLDEEDNRESDRHLVKLIDEDLRQCSIKKGVRVIYVGQDVSNLNFLLRQHTDKDDEVYHFAQNQISRRYLQNGFEHVPREAFVLPEPALADELVEAYFTHVNPGCPILDEEGFMAQYKRRDPADAPSLLILQAVLLAGAHVTRPRPARDTLKAAFFRRAKMLFEARVERNRDILVQAALLLTWYSDPVDDDVAANAHFWVGVAARIATGLGMHRNSGPSMFVPHDKRMWRRAWWILVQFDVLVSLQYGRPQAINLEDCDVQPLTPSDFEGCGERVQIDYVIQYTELCCMISFIMRERFGLRVTPERRKAALLEADKALADWSLKLPDNVRMSTADVDSWPALLHLTYNNFLILLHRPHPKASAYSDDYGPNDAEICSAAASVIVSIFEELREKDRVKYLWVSAVNSLFTAMIQIRVELRFSNPVLAINALRRFDSTLCSLRTLADYWLGAETILRLFESSKRLKHDMEMVKMKQPNMPKDGEPVIKGSTQSTPQMDIPTPQGQQLQSWYSKPHLNERLNYFAKQTPAPTVDNPAQAAQLGEPGDWRQLFSIVDSEPCGPFIPENLTDMEDEWRELYLHEPGMADYFQDTAWLPS
ncbi:acetamidase regulatory protein [Uncinocarpus reesii 1704]|uniref:Acetamidase regulatory protein n=1 Tax=Uncinocarpus reesii (strain UAMH 1704) TaxID=336963 RepID=C4JJL8_UNCRE|nr:acetamidase regulatory protein [Uncinocarpus reesii 1704]EEP76976.1 acetamidase regulatory protein [Uncinocarpus reesii 1704]